MSITIGALGLGFTAFRCLIGVSGLIFGLLQKDITGISLTDGNSETLIKKFQDAVLTGIAGNKTTDWLFEFSNKSYKKLVENLVEIDSDPNKLNHDIKRAVRKSYLYATLFGVESCLNDLGTIKNDATKWLDAVKKWINTEIEKLPDYVPPDNIKTEEVIRIFDQSLSENPDIAQQSFIKEVKTAVIEEIYETPIGEFSEIGYALLVKKINDGWNDFKPSNEKIVQLHINDLNLPADKKLKDRWFWLLCALFNEEYKTNERLKAAILKDLSLEHRKMLACLSVGVANLDRVLGQVKTAQDEILQLVRKIEREASRDPFYVEFQGVFTAGEVDKIVDFHSRSLVGRKKETEILDNFIKTEKSGYFIIKAPGGFGKTALVSRWVSQHKYVKDVFVAYHFFRQGLFCTQNTEEGLKNLLRQLVIYYEDSEHLEKYKNKELPNNANDLLGAIQGQLRKGVPKGNEPLVLVLDGLDEADDAGEKLVPFLENLPDGIHVLVSARAEIDEEPPYLRQWAKLVHENNNNVLFLEAFKIEDIKKWLWQTNAPTLSFDDELVRLIYERTKGFPLYLTYLIEDIVTEHKNGKTMDQIKELVQKMPKAFNDYLKKQFIDLCQSLPSDWQIKIQTLFSFLSVSLGALAKYDVKKLVGIGEVEINGFPQKVWRWIRIREDENGNRLFSFDHPLVKDVFTKSILQDETEQASNGLLIYCAEWQSHPGSSYALRYYAQHLRQDKRYDLLYEIAQNELFLEAQTQAFPNEPDIALKTLQTALQTALETDNVPMMAEFELMHAHKVLAKIIETPFDALKFSIERAISQAELIYLNNSENGILWLLLLAKRLCRENYLAESEKIIVSLITRNLPKLSERAYGRFASIAFLTLDKFYKESVTGLQMKIFQDDWFRDWKDFHKIENNIRDTEILEEELNEAIEDKDEKVVAEAMLWLAYSKAFDGHLTDALNLAKQIKLTLWRVEALILIAQLQELAGDPVKAELCLVEALKPTENGENKLAQAEAKISLAKTYARLEMKDEARKILFNAYKIVQKLDLPYLVDEGLISVTKALAEIVDTKTAFMVFAEISSHEAQLKALRLIAKAQAKAGKTQEAFETINKIDVPVYRRKALISVAKVQAKQGNHIEALNTSRKIKIPRDEAIIAIVKSQVKAGEIDLAHKTSKEIENIWARFKIYDLIYDSDESIDFPELLRIAKEIKDDYHRAEAFLIIGELLVKTGRDNKAEAVFNAVLQIARKTELLIELIMGKSLIILLAEVQAGLGKSANVLETIKEVKDEGVRAQILSGVAKAKIQLGQNEKSLEFLNSILIKKNIHYFEIAQAFAETNNTDYFKRLMIPCAFYLDSAYKMVGKLADLYPDHAEEIAVVLEKY